MRVVKPTRIKSPFVDMYSVLNSPNNHTQSYHIKPVVFQRSVLSFFMLFGLFLISGCNFVDDGVYEGDPVPHGPLNPVTKIYRCDIDDAVLITSGTTVIPLKKDTKIRVWHFQDSKEYICLLKGSARIKLPPTPNSRR